MLKIISFACARNPRRWRRKPATRIELLPDGERLKHRRAIADCLSTSTGRRVLARCLRMGVTPGQFKQMQDRVSGRRTAEPVLRGSEAPLVVAHQVILGLDPSLRGTGYGIIRLAKPVPETLCQGTISCPTGWERSRCLARISQFLRDLVGQHRPTVCAIEALFYAQNLQTALIMGEARGAAIAAIAEGGLQIFEVAPRKMKQAIVGYGAAQKLAVAKMVQRMLRLAEPPEPDAADALALALVHAQEQGRYSLAAARRV